MKAQFDPATINVRKMKKNKRALLFQIEKEHKKLYQ